MNRYRLSKVCLSLIFFTVCYLQKLDAMNGKAMRSRSYEIPTMSLKENSATRSISMPDIFVRSSSSPIGIYGSGKRDDDDNELVIQILEDYIHRVLKGKDNDEANKECIKAITCQVQTIDDFINNNDCHRLRIKGPMHIERHFIKWLMTDPVRKSANEIVRDYINQEKISIDPDIIINEFVHDKLETYKSMQQYKIQGDVYIKQCFEEWYSEYCRKKCCSNVLEMYIKSQKIKGNIQKLIDDFINNEDYKRRYMNLDIKDLAEVEYLFSEWYRITMFKKNDEVKFQGAETAIDDLHSGGLIIQNPTLRKQLTHQKSAFEIGAEL